ncbi:MAG: hypothetical protein WDW36_009725 [Sanguina aurantia]
MASLHTLHVAGGYLPKAALNTLCCPASPCLTLTPTFANLSLAPNPPPSPSTAFPHASNLSALFLDSLDATDATWCMLAGLNSLRVLQLGGLVLSSSGGGSAPPARHDAPPSLFDANPRSLPSLCAVEAFAVNRKLSLPPAALAMLLPALRCCRVEGAEDVRALVGHPTLQHLQVGQMKLRPADTVPSLPTPQIPRRGPDVPSCSGRDESPTPSPAAAGTAATPTSTHAAAAVTPQARLAPDSDGNQGGIHGQRTTAALHGPTAVKQSTPLSGWALLLSQLATIPTLTSLSLAVTHVENSASHLTRLPSPPTEPAPTSRLHPQHQDQPNTSTLHSHASSPTAGAGSQAHRQAPPDQLQLHCTQPGSQRNQPQANQPQQQGQQPADQHIHHPMQQAHGQQQQSADQHIHHHIHHPMQQGQQGQPVNQQTHHPMQQGHGQQQQQQLPSPPLLPSLRWLHLSVRGHMPSPSLETLLHDHCPELTQLQLQLREPGAHVDGWAAAVHGHPRLRRVALMWMRLHVSSVEALLASGRLEALHMAACAFDFAAYRQVLSAVPGAAQTQLTWETGYDVWEPPHPSFFPDPKRVRDHVTEAAGHACRYGPYDM